MKKLMVAVAAVGMAVCAEAASVAWGGYVANDGRVDETAQAGTVFNLIYIGANNYASQLNEVNYDTATGLVGTGTGTGFAALVGQTLLDTHVLTAAEATNFDFIDTFARADAEGGVNGNWLMTMYDATSPDTFWVGQYTVEGAGDSTGTASIADTSWSIGYGAHGTVTSSAAIPEPTSGLLMLLGVAGLALRRRRA